MSASRPAHPARQPARWLLPLLTALLALGLPPWRPRMPSAGLDPSWQSVMEAWALRELDGSIPVFTFGPLGFLHTAQFHPWLYPLQLGFWLMVAFTLARVLSHYAAQAHGWQRLLVLPLSLLAIGWTPDPWLALLPLCAAWLLLDFARPAPRGLLAWLLVLTALAVQVKFTAFMAAAAFAVVTDAARWLHQRKPPLLSAGLFAASWLLHALLTGDPNWPGHLLAQLAVAAGYGSAMQIAGPTSDVLWPPVVAALMALAVLATPVAAVAETRWAGLRPVWPALLTLMLLFLLFKGGVIRHDTHFAVTSSGFVLVGLLVWLRSIALGAHPAVRAAALGAVLVAAALMLPVPARYGFAPPTAQTPAGTLYWLLIERPWAGIEAIGGLLRDPSLSRLRSGRDQALAMIRNANPLPAELSGSVDVIGFEQSIVLAHGLDYRPRPVFQSYSAYTAGLARRNAAHFAGTRAPDHVLLAIEPIDGRLAMIEDAPSWLPLWTRYDPRELLGRFLWLERRSETDRTLHWDGERRQALRWGEAYTPAYDDATLCRWLEVDIRPSLLGRLASLAYKAPVVEVVLEREDASAEGGWREDRRRFISGLGAAGFLASPMVESPREFIEACAAQRLEPARRVRALRWTTRATWAFQPRIAVRERGLRIAGGPAPRANGRLRAELDWLRLLPELVEAGARTCAEAPRAFGERLLAHAPCQIELPAEPGQRLEAHYGLFEGAWTEGQTEGVVFRIEARILGAWQPLAERALNPREVIADREVQHFDLRVPAGADRLRLVTESRAGPGWEWSWWGPVSMRSDSGAQP